MASFITSEHVRFLGDRGIDLLAVVCVADLPPALVTPMQEARIELPVNARIVLLGNAGPAVWHAVHGQQSTTGRVSDHPIDEYSSQVATDFSRHFLSGYDSQILYPSTLPIPLIALGEYCGWSSPSRLGMGIHRDYGLWFAYRAAILTLAPLEPTQRLAPTDVCANCIDKPCVDACPAGAVSIEQTFDLAVCSDWRLIQDSVCESTCLARRACPVGTSSGYTYEQLAHHMHRSLPALRAWRSRGKRDT